jgi:cell division protein ZapA (FtsZ GTPase activity inhibitor)
LDELLKIKVSIADRVYPLTIKRSEEESIRAAAKKIDGILKKYEESYAVRDKQDLLAMCALQIASRDEKNRNQNLVDGNMVSEKLSEMQQLVNKLTQ